MSFSSLVFLVFVAVVLPVYYLLPDRLRLIWALAGSFVFYGWGNFHYCGLLLLISVIAYAGGLAIDRAPSRARTWLVIGLALNLGILAFFKYLAVLAGIVGQNLSGDGLGADSPRLQVALPLGVSFYTLNAIGYLVDVYRRTVRPEISFVRLALFIALFPHLIAGPILRAGNLLPQLRAPLTVDWSGMGRGIELIAWGYFLKLCLADNAAPLVDRRFADPADFGGADHALGVALFAFQIYGDFAGYSLIAIGFGRLLGYDFGINFARPYLAGSFREFWHRWHISLSTWLRDYLYIPLGGNRRGLLMTCRNLLLTMVLGGLWHGAAWTFLLWGGLHGLFLAVEHIWRRLGGLSDHPRWQKWSWPFRVVLVFALTCLTWVPFRAESLADTGVVLGRILAWAPAKGLAGFEEMHFWRAIVATALVVAVDIAGESRRLVGVYRAWLPIRVLGVVALSWLILLIGRFEGAEFIYFQF